MGSQFVNIRLLRYLNRVSLLTGSASPHLMAGNEEAVAAQAG
jgi:hypothetical protein